MKITISVPEGARSYHEAITDGAEV